MFSATAMSLGWATVCMPHPTFGQTIVSAQMSGLDTAKTDLEHHFFEGADVADGSIRDRVEPAASPTICPFGNLLRINMPIEAPTGC